MLIRPSRIPQKSASEGCRPSSRPPTPSLGSRLTLRACPARTLTPQSSRSRMSRSRSCCRLRHIRHGPRRFSVWVQIFTRVASWPVSRTGPLDRRSRVRGTRGRHAHHAGDGSRQPPVPLAEQRHDSAAASSARTTVASSRMPAAQAGGEHLDVGVGRRGERREREEQDQRRARHEAPRAPETLDHRARRSTPVRSYSSRTRVRMKTS